MNNFQVLGRHTYKKDCEYRVRSTITALHNGVAGKIGRPRKFEGKTKAWVQFEDNNVYKLNLSDLNPLPIRGGHEVNYVDVLSSELFKDIFFETGVSKVRNLVKKLPDESYRRGLTDNLPQDTLDSVHTFVDLSYIPANPNPEINKVRLFLSPYTTVEVQRERETLYHRSTEYSRSRLVEIFEKATGKDLWNLMRLFACMDVIPCRCGSWSLATGKSIDQGYHLFCIHCKNTIYAHGSFYENRAENSIERIFASNYM